MTSQDPLAGRRRDLPDLPALEVGVPADPAQVGVIRRALRQWLARMVDALTADEPADLDRLEDIADDLVLATSEALENVVDHAFADARARGSMTLEATLEDDGVRIVVTDDGRWRVPRPGPSTRGRGFTLMQSLATADVVHGEAGTTVTLRRGPLRRAEQRDAEQQDAART